MNILLFDSVHSVHECGASLGEKWGKWERTGKVAQVKPRLTGSHTQTADDRGRLAVPAKMMGPFRKLGGQKDKEAVEVTICVTPQRRLGVYPRRVFDQMIDDLEELALEDHEIYKLRTAYLNHMEEQSLDKQNRFKIPSMLADAFDLKGEVVLMGSGEMVEVVSREEWKRQLSENVVEMNNQASLLMAYRRKQRETQKQNENGSTGSEGASA